MAFMPLAVAIIIGSLATWGPICALLALKKRSWTGIAVAALIIMGNCLMLSRWFPRTALGIALAFDVPAIMLLIAIVVHTWSRSQPEHDN